VNATCVLGKLATRSGVDVLNERMKKKHESTAKVKSKKGKKNRKTKLVPGCKEVLNSRGQCPVCHALIIVNDK